MLLCNSHSLGNRLNWPLNSAHMGLNSLVQNLGQFDIQGPKLMISHSIKEIENIFKYRF